MNRACEDSAGGPGAPPDAVRAAAQLLDPLPLGEWVDEHATERDFFETFREGLELDLRADLLFARGVVEGSSNEQMYDVLNNNLRTGTLVFTMVPGSVGNETVALSGLSLPRNHPAHARYLDY